MPRLGAARDIAVAVRDFILGHTDTWDVPFENLGDFSPVYAGAKLAMYSKEYLSNTPARIRLQEIMNAIVAAQPRGRAKPTSNNRAAGDRTPTPAYLDHLHGPVLGYILNGDILPIGVYDPRRVQKVLQALAGTEPLKDEAVLTRFIRVQQSLAVAPGVHDFNAKEAGRNRHTPFRQRPEWSQEAACAPEDPNSFYPERGAAQKLLLETCMKCVRRDDCLEIALVNKEGFGFWGGLSERGRRKVKKLVKEGKPIAIINATIAKARGATEGMPEDQLKRLIAKLVMQPDEPQDEDEEDDSDDGDEADGRQELAS